MDIAALLALREGTTPGPWMAESGHEQSNGQLYWQITDGSDAIMQNQFCWCQGDHAANARLIAAAPDLLDAIAALQSENAALKEAFGMLEDALQEAGDDYPGSSMQQWCQQQVQAARDKIEEPNHG